MKEDIIGKRFSKIKTASISSKNTPEEIRDFFNKVEYSDYGDLVLYATEIAATVLKKAGLPVTPIYSYSDNNKECRGFIDRYVIDKLKKEPDSPEGLSARILSNIERQKNNSHSEPLKLAYELGELTTLLKVYGIESSSNKGNAEGKRKPEEFEILAEYLVKEYPDLTFNKLWKKIEDSPDEIKGCYITAGGKICCTVRDSNGEIIKESTRAKSTFQTEYITPTKKKYKNNS